MISDDNGRVIKRIDGTYDRKAGRIGKRVSALASSGAGWVAFKLPQGEYPGVRIECTERSPQLESDASEDMVVIPQVRVTYSQGVSLSPSLMCHCARTVPMTGHRYSQTTSDS